MPDSDITDFPYAPVQAEWIAFEARHQLHPLQTVYVDPGSIEREGHRVTLSALIDWKAMQGGRSPTRFYSTKFSKQFECKEKLVRTLAATDFYDTWGRRRSSAVGALQTEASGRL